MEHGSGRNAAVFDDKEDLGSLIRASIDIDSWIPNKKTQLDGQDSGIFCLQASNEQKTFSYPHFESSWDSEYCEKGFGLEIDEGGCGSSVQSFDQPECHSSSATDVRNLDVDDEGSRKEEIGSLVTLEKTPELTRLDQDVTNLEKEVFDKTDQNYSGFRNLTFQDAFNKQLNEFRGTEGNQPHHRVPQEYRKTIACCKCHNTIEPGDWIRTIRTPGSEFAAVYHMNCFHCDYCKGMIRTDQYYTFHTGKLICNFDFQMLINMPKVTDHNQKLLVILHRVKEGAKKSVRISPEQEEILEYALRVRNVAEGEEKYP